jgi:hypothetical protein
MNFIEWKHNSENNKKYMQSNNHFFNDKKMQKLEASWLYQFNIGDVMYLKKIGVDKFLPGSQLGFISDVNFLIDLLLFLRYCSN